MKDRSTGLRKLLEEQVADIYYAEQQLVKTLPKLAEKSRNKELRQAFESHLTETKNHVQRLEKVFQLLGKDAKGEKCPAIDGILKEGKELMDDFGDSPALDAALVAAGQKAEHYEIATYGFMCEWAKELGLSEVQDLLHQTLEEEIGADEKLTSIAESAVNADGMREGVKA